MSVTTLEPVALDVDLGQVIPCMDNRPDHDHPADVILALDCPGCATVTGPLCWWWYDWFFDGEPVYHEPCHRFIDVHTQVRVIEVLRPR